MANQVIPMRYASNYANLFIFALFSRMLNLAVRVEGKRNDHLTTAKVNSEKYKPKNVLMHTFAFQI